MADILDVVFAGWSKGGFDWSKNNCALSVLRWIAHVKAMGYSHGYTGDDERAAQLYLEASGGMIAIAHLMAEWFELPITDDPKRGDVGLVDSAKGLICAIYAGDGLWATRSMRGVVFEGSKARFAWSVGWSGG